MKILKNSWILVILLLVLLGAASLIVTNCNSRRQADQNINSAVSQNEVENIEALNVALSNKIHGYVIAQDSLVKCIKLRDEQLIRKEKERSQIALKYTAEKSRLREMPDDTAAALFLDRAQCNEDPVEKYSDKYLIDIEPIRFYNDLATDFDQQVEINASLQSESDIKSMQIKDLNSLCGVKDKELFAVKQINENHVLIESEKDKQITAGNKKYKAEHRKLIVTKVVAGVVIAIETAIVVLTLVK